MTQVPTKVETDEEKAAIQAIFKKAGYGHFHCCTHPHAPSYTNGEVTNMKRGVRICFFLTNSSIRGGQPGRWDYGYVEVRKPVTKQVWTKNGSKPQTLTEYCNENTYFCLKNGEERKFRGAKEIKEFDTPQELVQALIWHADICEGEKAITAASLKKGILQNLILEDMKSRLVEKYKDWAGFEVAFAARAKVYDSPASLRLKIPALNYDRGEGEETSSYQLGEVYVQLADGQFDFIFGDHGSRSKHRKTPIPNYADPKFDPELIWQFIVKGIEAMLPARETCTAMRREMDLLDIRIKKEKQRLRDEFEAIWQTVWSEN